MTRFNYLAPPRRFAFRATTTLAIDNRVRGPLAALVATVLLTAALSVVQLERLQAARIADARVMVSLNAAEPELRAVGALREQIVRRSELQAAASAVRVASLAHADELIWIGNRLPAHTWLRSLRYENDAYILEGDSDRASDVGQAMLTLHDASRGTMPQLMSLHTQGAGGPTRVHYTLRVDVHR